ncbi:hypothetical protein HDV01_003786 [Terramyces sp. JEL0728]|nr:hypothetical protein HDV01_003786 [Terramyces sp. JEL0728]
MNFESDYLPDLLHPTDESSVNDSDTNPHSPAFLPALLVPSDNSENEDEQLSQALELQIPNEDTTQAIQSINVNIVEDSVSVTSLTFSVSHRKKCGLNK